MDRPSACRKPCVFFAALFEEKLFPINHRKHKLSILDAQHFKKMVSVAWPAMRAASLSRYCPWATIRCLSICSLTCKSENRITSGSRISTNSCVESIRIFDAPYLAGRSAYSILRQARNPARVAGEMENALEEGRIDNALNTYELYKEQEGFPRKSLLNKLITTLAQLGKLDKAYDLVLSVMEAKKQDSLLNPEAMSELCLSFAKADNPVPASSILRILVQMEQYPPVDFWVAVISHMIKTQNGAFLSSQLVMEFGHLFKDNRVDPRKRSNQPLLAMKPNIAAFNTVLQGCLAFGLTKKAEQLIELMPRLGVKPDAVCYGMMAQIYERNGRRDELKKLKRFIDEAPEAEDYQYQQFYNSLLATHLNFGDLDAASQLVLDMLRKAKAAQRSLAAAKSVVEAVQSCSLSQAIGLQQESGIQDAGFLSLKTLEVESSLETVQNGCSIAIIDGNNLVSSENRILTPNQNAFARLVKGYLEADRVLNLSEFLVKVHHVEGAVSIENSMCVQVINACIELGWFDEAHDILDEMHLAEIPTGSGVYSELMKAYCKAGRSREATLLLKQVKKQGLQLDTSCYGALIEMRVSHKDMQGALELFKEMKDDKISASNETYQLMMENFAKEKEPRLMARLLDEVKDDKDVSAGVHEWNSVIHFFCRTRLMKDAKKAYKRMKDRGYQPNAQTFHSLVHGFSAAGGMYEEITELWAEMKRLAFPNSESAKPLRFDQELLDALLYSFIRGGFFGRALEVIQMMEQFKFFIDKVRHRQIYLKYHRNLYKNKKPPKMQTEGQFTRRQQVMAFKQWAGLD